MKQDTFVLSDSNQLKTLYFEMSSQISELPIFTFIDYLSHIIRDCFTIITDVILNIILIISIRNYHMRRTAANVQPQQIFFSRSDTRNVFISMIVSVLTIANHLILLIEFFSPQRGIVLDGVLYFSNFFKNLVNFFLLIILNRLFRRNFLALIPKWRCARLFRSDRSDTPRIELETSVNMPIRIINTATESTYL